MPSFCHNSLAMRSSPQIGFSPTICSISWRNLSGIARLPGFDFRFQNSRKALRIF
jgi:hypothetical protein